MSENIFCAIDDYLRFMYGAKGLVTELAPPHAQNA